MAKFSPSAPPRVYIDGQQIPVKSVNIHQERPGLNTNLETTFEIRTDRRAMASSDLPSFTTTISERLYKKYTTSTKVNVNIKEKKNMAEETKQQKKMRIAIAEAIRGTVEDALAEGDIKVKFLELTKDKKGPMGGTSSQVLGYADTGEEGGLVGFAVNIYADSRIQETAEERLEAIEKEKELREQVFGESEEK